MSDPKKTVLDFYASLQAGDAPAALALMTPDIEWLTMWHYKVAGRGPAAVAEGLLKPLAAEWSAFTLTPTDLFVDGGTVISLGRFAGVHARTGKRAEAEYAHVWTVQVGRIARFRQYIDTLAVALARQA